MTPDGFTPAQAATIVAALLAVGFLLEWITGGSHGF